MSHTRSRPTAPLLGAAGAKLCAPLRPVVLVMDPLDLLAQALIGDRSGRGRQGLGGVGGGGDELQDPQIGSTPNSSFWASM